MSGKESKLPLTKATPSSGLFEWHPFDTLRRQVDRLFEEFPTHRSVGDFPSFDRLMSAWPSSPPVDFVEKGAAYEISAELPGLDEKDVDIKFANGVLTIHGEKKEEKEVAEQGYYFSERRYGAFKRSFRVPDDVESEKIKASFDKGVLKISLPKAPDAQTREKKIQISAK